MKIMASLLLAAALTGCAATPFQTPNAQLAADAAAAEPSVNGKDAASFVDSFMSTASFVAGELVKVGMAAASCQP
jgi:hypothetical protein